MSARDLAFQVHGLPAPQGSKRHVGHGVMIESSKKVKPWREAVKYAALDTIDEQHDGEWPPISGGVHVLVIFQFPRSPSHYGAGRNSNVLKPSAPKWPMGKTVHGDVEKLARSTFDGLSDAGVWFDDKQVVMTDLTKQFASNGVAGAFIRITALDELADTVHQAVSGLSWDEVLCWPPGKPVEDAPIQQGLL